MTFLPRVILITLAVFGAMNLAASAALLLSWSRLNLRRRPHVLLAARAIPAALSVLAAVATAFAFALFEPRIHETTGRLFFVTAAAGAVFLLRALYTAIRGAIRTRRVTRRWLEGATPAAIPGTRREALVVPSAFPIVAVVGVRRPKLIVSQSVIDACSPQEMAAVIAHEERHVSAGHNFCRAWLTAMPDGLAWLPAADRIADEWHLAAEREADDAAACASPTGRLDLAGALVRVARLMPTGAPAIELPVSALYRGEPIEQRVKRLLDDDLDRGARQPWRTPLAVFAVALAATLWLVRPIYEVLELAVEHLP